MERIDSKLQRRQLELMKKRFDVDEENKIVTIDLYYDKVDDVLQSNLDTKVPTFNRGKFDQIKDLISDFPSEYRSDINFKFDDYQDYKAEEVLEGFNDAVELTHYLGNKEHKKKWIQITFLLIAGILILYFLAQGVISTWFGLGEIGSSVVKEAIDITSWVFIWEAVSLMFLSPSESRVVSLTLAYKLRRVSLLDNKGNVLVSEDYRDSYALTAKERKLRVFGKYALLISGAAFFGLGASNLINYFVTLKATIESGVAYLISYTILSGALIAFEILGGLAAMSAFAGKGGRIYKMALPFGIVVFLINVLLLIVTIYSRRNIVTAVIGTLISTAYLLGVIVLKITRDKSSEEKK